jgi:hypothetical protein
MPFLDDAGRLTEEGILESYRHGSGAHAAVEILLKGPEERLPEGIHFCDTPGAKSNEPLIIANGGPDPYPIVSNSGVAKAVDALDARVDRGDARNGADDHKRNEDSNPIDQDKALSVKPQFSSSEKDISVVKPTSPNLAKHYFRTTAKLRVLAKRPAIERTSSVRQAVVEGRDMSQVALESRNTSACAGSCSNRPPPLFGVGF